MAERESGKDRRAALGRRIERQLAWYSVAAGAGAAVAGHAGAAVISHAPDVPLTTSPDGDLLEIDLNGDEVFDVGFATLFDQFEYTVGEYMYTIVSDAVAYVADETGGTSGMNRFLASPEPIDVQDPFNPEGVPFIARLDEDETIDPSDEQFLSQLPALQTSLIEPAPVGGGFYNYEITETFGNFTDGESGFVGVRFLIEDDAHAAWVRVSIDPEDFTVTVHEWAYEDVAGASIGAGEGAASPTLPADFDGDGDVDAFDLGIWQTGFGTAEGATRADGDADGDGDVDAFDLGIWQTQFGTGVSEAIPEPTSLGLLAAGGVGLLRRKRRGEPIRVVRG